MSKKSLQFHCGINNAFSLFFVTYRWDFVRDERNNFIKEIRVKRLNFVEKSHRVENISMNSLIAKRSLLSVRIVEVLGRDIPMKIFTETQKIEKDGGMMIMVCAKMLNLISLVRQLIELIF